MLFEDETFSYLALASVLATTFLAYVRGWRDSTTSFALAGCMAVGVAGKLLIFFGPEPKIPLFLVLYSIACIGFVLYGLWVLRQEQQKKRALTSD